MSISAEKTPYWLQQASGGIIKHMNDDHSNSIVSTLHAQYKVKDIKAKMESLKTNGYYASSKGNLYFLAFDNSCKNAKEYKDELVKHAKMYRNYELN